MAEQLDLGIYLGIMLDSVNRKKKVLEELYAITEKQNHLIMAEEFNTDSFADTLEDKQALIDKLEELDNGFNSTYNRIEEQIKEKAVEHADKIRRLQALIKEVTELGVKIQVLEKTNKSGIENKQQLFRQGKKQFTVNRQTADKYYKTQAGLADNNPVFLDKKN